MGLIEEFIARYRKEYDFYDQAARLLAQILEGRLQAAGIRSMVTSRAKAVGRLEAKVRQRATTRNYTSVDDIYNDIVDLAGARVALYFPGERTQVDSIIRSLFAFAETSKEFPASSNPTYDKRFSGYWATHYRVQLRETSLSDAQKRYAEARIEIQVASVLMHAWAEVEHDLAYKPLQGKLSAEEYAILDELNGLVMAGEIALERLQKAGEARVAAGGRPFSNHYDLAAHLLNATGPILKGPIGDTALGRVDLLFDFLSKLGLATPDQLKPYVVALHADIERRPLAEQIIDQLLGEDEARYKILRRGARESDCSGRLRTRRTGSCGARCPRGDWFFLGSVDRFRANRSGDRGADSGWRRPEMPTGRVLERLGLLDDSTRREVERIRRIRNNLVHGFELPDPADLREAGVQIQAINERLRQKNP